MAGQGAVLKFSAAKSAAKGAGHDLGCNHGGSKPTPSDEGHEIGKKNSNKKMAHVGKHGK